MKRTSVWQGLLVAVVAFGAGVLVPLQLRPGSTADSDADVRMVSEHSALLYQSLGIASDATFALLFLDDQEKARRWHLGRLEAGIKSSLDASRHVDSLEGAIPNILLSLQKARPFLEANESSSSSLDALSELEKWLKQKNREAIETEE